MRKVFLFATFILVSFCSFGQKSDSTQIPDTAKLTLSKVYSDVKSGLQGLSQALKVPAAHVYSIVIKQQITRAISDLIFDSVFIILSIVLFSIGMRTAKKVAVKKTDELNNICIVSFILFGLSFLVALFSFWSDYSTIVSGFVNPEYGAIKDIVSFIK